MDMLVEQMVTVQNDRRLFQQRLKERRLPALFGRDNPSTGL